MRFYPLGNPYEKNNRGRQCLYVTLLIIFTSLQPIFKKKNLNSNFNMRVWRRAGILWQYKGHGIVGDRIVSLYVPRIKVSPNQIGDTNNKLRMYLFKNLQNCLTLDKGACTGTKSNRDDQRIQYNKRHVSIHILIDRAGNLVCLSKISWKNMFIHIWSSFFGSR